MRNNPARAPTYFPILYRLCLQVLTWEKDSHGLFDYEETKHHKNYFEIQGPCKLFRDWQTSQTCALSNNDIKKGMLPDEHYSFHSSIQLKHNGNIERKINLIKNLYLEYQKNLHKMYTEINNHRNNLDH